jgi:hypothetical protein
MSAKFKGVPYFKSLLRLKAPTARVQTTLKMFLRQCTLRLVRSAKFPPGGGNKSASSQRTNKKQNEGFRVIENSAAVMYAIYACVEVSQI